MVDTDQINELHRLYWAEQWSIRRIERHLKMCWRTIRKYLDVHSQVPVSRHRSGKIDPFKGNISEWLEKDPQVTAAVIEQRLRPLGYCGGHSILQCYVRKVRPHAPKRAFVRMEPLAGERFEVDWGHFGALSYSGMRANSMPSPWSMRTAAGDAPYKRALDAGSRSPVTTNSRK